MGTFRPAFRHVAQSLTDIDLILVEEAFERLLLVGRSSHDYLPITQYSDIVLSRTMTEFSAQWVYLLAYGDVQERFIEETKNLHSLSMYQSKCCGR